MNNLQPYHSKIAQLIDEAINDCLTYGSGKVQRDGLTIETDWNQNGRDIEVYIIRDGRVLADWLEKDAASYKEENQWKTRSKN